MIISYQCLCILTIPFCFTFLFVHPHTKRTTDAANSCFFGQPITTIDLDFNYPATYAQLPFHPNYMTSAEVSGPKTDIATLSKLQTIVKAFAAAAPQPMPPQQPLSSTTMDKSGRQSVVPPPLAGLSMAYRCRKCGRGYRTKYTCNRHERTECGIPAKFSCSACGFRAKHKHNLKQHYESVHMGKRTTTAGGGGGYRALSPSCINDMRPDNAH